MRVSRIAALAFILARLACADDPPSGESLVMLYIERSGGAEAYAKAKNMTMTGTVAMAAQNIAGSVSIYEEGDKSYTSMEFPGIGKIEEGFDGETAWQSSELQGTRVLEGEEKLAAKRAASLSMINGWRAVYKEAHTIGAENIDGKPAWKVEMTPREGKPETFYFDQESGLLVRISAVISTAMGEISTTSSMTDFKKVDGILTPFTMTEKAMGANIVMTFRSIGYNVDIPKNRFDLPPAVHDLLEKKKQQTAK